MLAAGIDLISEPIVLLSNTSCVQSNYYVFIIVTVSLAQQLTWVS